LTDKLLVILNYSVSDILQKGEYPPGYYNPGDVFDEVHLLITVKDEVDLEKIQFTGGRSRVFVHVIPAPSMKQSFGWQPFLLKSWVKQCVMLVKEISPNLMRVHNSFIQGYLASEIKKELHIPYVLSLHGVWDRDDLGTLLQKFIHVFRKKLEHISLKNSDAVIAVYSPVVRYAREYGANNIHVIYNAVAARDLPRKQNYSLSSPPKLITINRLNREKNPENIVRAVKDIDCHYYIVGNGPYRPRIEALVKELDLDQKVEFINSMPNQELLKMLADCDILVSHCDYWGISKSMIESALLGLPIVINNHPIEPIADLDGGWVSLCDNSPEEYRKAIQTLLHDHTFREQLGENAYDHAHENFDPEKLKEKVAAIYRGLMIQSPAA
jgi:glycosyltransferase involved in cell wall biosynthesis